MKRLVSLEYLFASVFVAIFFVSVGEFAWWWLLILFLVFDISAIGYMVSNKIGAVLYNIGHSLIGPVVVLSLFIFQGHEWQLFVGLLWLFHIFVDRALGFGLKHGTSFHHTHLGSIGKAKKK